MKKNPGRAERRLAAREGARRDGRARNMFAITRGQVTTGYRAGRTSTVTIKEPTDAVR